ncbi:MAG TPA: hypothetical protein VFZ56_08680 [Gemmatimonadaceae bacterium]
MNRAWPAPTCPRVMRVSLASLLLVLIACGSEPTGPPDGSPGTPQQPLVPSISAAVSTSYQREFQESVPRPAIFDQDPRAGCTGAGHLMTTAYLPTGNPGERRLLEMYLSRDGTSLVTAREGGLKHSRVLRIIPAGTFNVLTVLVTYPETTDDASLALLSQAQAGINAQHELFATSRGYASPIVVFSFANVLLPPGEISDPRALSSVRAALADNGLSTVGYDFVVVLNPDPDRPEGGFAAFGTAAPYFVYMGNYGLWKSPLSAAAFVNVAAAAYHHEIGHHWGWRHDWTECGDPTTWAPFITAPILFGWEDTDGDRTPEILDTTPYGR